MLAGFPLDSVDARNAHLLPETRALCSISPPVALCGRSPILVVPPWGSGVDVGDGKD